MSRLFALLGWLGGCTYVGERTYAEQIRDVDGDGVEAERFGGEDCRDDDPTIQRCDADGDGYRAIVAGGDDCDDTDPAVHPGLSFFLDADRDGYGDASVVQVDCLAPLGHVADATDCDDSDPDIHPGSEETCDAEDRDCDGDPYQGADASQWFHDRDGDGFGLDIGDEAACSPPPGQVANGDDCDDTDAGVHPGAPQVWYDGIDQDCSGSGSDFDQDGDGQDTTATPGGVDCDDLDPSVAVGQIDACDGVDNDCDLLIDDAEPDVEQSGQLTWYLDSDRDGYGDSGASSAWCPDAAPEGWVIDDGDCDDTRSTVHPGATEFCNGRNDDCTGIADDGAVDRVTVYEDADGDGFGNLESLACTVTDGYSAFGADCNDADPATWPGAPEICDDAQRQDCSLFSVYDCDSDGTEAVGWGGTDCDDADADVHVDATEACDGIDNDCDLLLDGADPDVDPQSFPDWFRDVDGDGYGVDNLVAASTCTPPPLTSSNTLDCDDILATVNPDATEACNGRDDDCDGSVDEDATDELAVWFYDGDGDGAGDPSIVLLGTCTPPVDEPWVARGDDCDDGDAALAPTAAERCDGIDNDCDGWVDDEDPGIGAYAPHWYADADGDGFGLASVITAQCAPPADHVAVAGDCNDFDVAVNPGAPELCNAGIDDDCDGLSDDADPDIDSSNTWYRDGDGDGYGDPLDAVSSCQPPGGYALLGADCDDADPSVSPAALEVCDGGVDDDCNGLADDEDVYALGAVVWYVDGDGDGAGEPTPIFACVAPDDAVAFPGDCDDTDAAISPFAAEICNGIDDDCDALADDADPSALGTLWYLDADGDGYGGPSLALGCDLADSGHVLVPGDCDDAQPGTHPAAIEVCDGVDQDCDAAVDDAAIDGSPFLADGDGDGAGAGAPVFACAAAVGTVPDPGDPSLADCDDGDREAYPGNPVEHCDGADNDCDGRVDAADLDSATTGPTAYADADGDGWGDGEPLICTSPYSGPGLVASAGDCDDGDSGVHPGATERCNTRDDDCDTLVDGDDAVAGGTTWFADDDADGFGRYLDAVVTCGAAPAEDTWSTVPGDCDDADPAAWPESPRGCPPGGRSEVCAARSWFGDGDGDGYGDRADRVTGCEPPAGYVDNGTDCDDAVAGDVPTVAVADGPALAAAVAAGGCARIALASGFEASAALTVPVGATLSITSADLLAPGALLQSGTAPVLSLPAEASLFVQGVYVFGSSNVNSLVEVGHAAASLSLVDVALDGGGTATAVVVDDGDLVVSAVTIRSTDALGSKGSAIDVRAAASFTGFDVVILDALGSQSVQVSPEGDDVAFDGLLVADSARILVEGNAGVATLSAVRSHHAIAEAVLVNSGGSVVVFDRLLVAGAGADGLEVRAGTAEATHVTIAGCAGNGVDALSATLTDAIVYDSGGFDLFGVGLGITWDHALFGTSSGAVSGVSRVLGAPEWVSYHPDEPWRMRDFHPREGSVAIGAATGGEDLGYHLASEGWADDSDGNALPDGWERRWFGEVGAPQYGDVDLDLVLTAEELARGTAPTHVDTDGDGAPDGADFAPLDPFAT